MISVIVPVYNVEGYVDDCIKSIVSQTYQDIEILLINDGSTDKSGARCYFWAQKDKRIRVIDKENEGQALSRNLGVVEAKGEYITFVDSDDWIAPTMLELLYNSIKKYDAEIAMCDANIEQPDGKFSDLSLQRLDKSCVDIQADPNFILTVKYTMWAKLFKKEHLIMNNILEPNIRFEDFATVPIIYALANKVACVDMHLYNYRYRASSTIHDVKYIEDRFIALECLIENFKKRNILETWYDVVQRIFTERAIVLMRHIYPLLSKYYQFCYEKYDYMLNEYFGMSLSNLNSHFSSYCRTGKIDANIFGKLNLAVVGSYNLMIIAKMIMNVGTPDFLENHYAFSGLISMMSEPDEIFRKIDLHHQSEFRRKHVVQDFTKSFANRNCCEFKDIDYILVDLLEERFDTGLINGHYFTISDAFIDIRDGLDLNYSIVDKYSLRAKELWEKSCLRFIDLLNDYVGMKKVILVKSYLSEKIQKNDGSVEIFENVDLIKKINFLLSEKYKFFIENAPDVLVIEMKSDSYFYTDENFRHGCYPWHLNNKEYWKIRTNIIDMIRSNISN